MGDSVSLWYAGFCAAGNPAFLYLICACLREFGLGYRLSRAQRGTLFCLVRERASGKAEVFFLLLLSALWGFFGETECLEG